MQGVSLGDPWGAQYNHLPWIVINVIANKTMLETMIGGESIRIRLNSNKVVQPKPAEEEDAEVCTPPPPPLTLSLSFPSVENALAIAAQDLIGCGAMPTQLCVSDCRFHTQVDCVFKGVNDFTEWLNIPIRLPGDGGCTVTFELSEPPPSANVTAENSLVYPSLKKHGIDMWHHSTWNATRIRIPTRILLEGVPSEANLDILH